MSKFSKKFFGLLMVMILGVSVFAGCSAQNPSSGTDQATGDKKEATKKEEKKSVKLGYVNWSEGVAMTNLAKVILEEKMGYEVEMTMADAAPIFTAVAGGDYDAFMDAWLPVTHADYMEKYGDKLDDLGTNFEGARIGLVVPTYVDIDTIEEMNDVKDKFNGQIVGIDAGAGIMKATNKAIEDYGLNYELMTSSGPMMTAALKKAIDKNEWVAVTGWKPHWMFAKWDLKFLEDSKEDYGAVESIHTVARKGIQEDMPVVAEFLKNFKMDDQQLGDLMGQIANSEEDADVVAKKWMEDHEELISSWIPAE